MDFTSQVITLQRAKEIKELGFFKDSILRWYHGGPEGLKYSVLNDERTHPHEEEYPAYTLSEIFEIVKNCELTLVPLHSAAMTQWGVGLIDTDERLHSSYLGDTLLDAAAQALIYLIKTGYITWILETK